MWSLLVTSLLLSSVLCSPSGRIINGQDTEFAPYVAMVSGYNAFYGTFGGGSFISLSHVLTAGNLIYDMDWWYVDYGSNVLGNLPYESATAILHPAYDPETYANDIGILILSNPADSSEWLGSPVLHEISLISLSFQPLRSPFLCPRTSCLRTSTNRAECLALAT